MSSLLSGSSFEQIKKFILIGILSTALNYTVFFIAYECFHVYYAWAHVYGYLCGVVFGYIYNRSWTFKSVITKKKWEFGLYFTLYTLSLMTSVSALKILVEFGRLNPLTANILSIGVSAAINYVGSKFVIFNSRMLPRFQKLLRYCTPTFWIILLIKIIASACFGSHFIVNGFIPFISYFSTTFHNPYQHFIMINPQPFAYPAGMLAFVSFPFIILHMILPQTIFARLNIQLFIIRIPVLVFDTIIYFVLCILLPTKEKKVLWLYWASPILFYINYFHGQLDVIPTAILFVSLLALYENKNWLSFILLGIGIATKTNLLIALPFYVIYIYRSHFSFPKITALIGTCIGCFVLCNPYLLSPAFLNTVLNNPEQQRLFSLMIPFGYEHLAFFVAPAAILFILFTFATYKKLNWDALLLGLGLSYIVLIALVPPMQGWYYWSVPFLVYFFIKYKDSWAPSLWTLSILYLLYFLFSRDSDIFESLQPIAATVSTYSNPYFALAEHGIDADKIVNTIFTGLESVLLFSTTWVYKTATQTINLYQKKKERFLLGIAGDSGVGKSTLAMSLEKVIGIGNIVCLHGDDAHKWERSNEHWEHYTHLNPRANHIHTDHEHTLQLLRGETIERAIYDHTTGTFSGPQAITPNRFILFEGLMPFFLEDMRQLYDLKIYIEADELLRTHWKITRDQTSRKHKDTEKVRTEIERRKPDANTFIQPQKEYADWVIRYVLHTKDEAFGVEYTLKNTIGIDTLSDMLSNEEGLAVTHTYHDMHRQSLTVSGTIQAERVKAIAYRLFPNVHDLVEHDPEFDADISGINQLLFLQCLESYYRFKNEL